MKRRVGVGLSVALLGTAVSAQPAAIRTTTPVYRIGGPNADGPYLFEQMPRLVADTAGFIFARIPGEPSVSVFAPDGKYVRTIGRRGQGPGEFDVVIGIGFIGDTLWVSNAPTPRISLFQKNGAHIMTERTPFEGYAQRFASIPGISALLAGGHVFVTPPWPALGNETRMSLPALVGKRAMRTYDTIATMTETGLLIPHVATWWYTPIPMSPLVAIAPTGGGVAIADWSDAEPGVVNIRFRSPAGTVTWQRRLQLSAPEIPRRVRDSLITVGVGKVTRQLDAARQRGTAPPGSTTALVERGLQLPRRFAPAGRLVVGTDGTLWIQQMKGVQGDTWIVLDRTGNTLFHVRVPTRVTVEQASQHSVWGTEQDELGVPYIVRLRVDGVAR